MYCGTSRAGRFSGAGVAASDFGGSVPTIGCMRRDKIICRKQSSSPLPLAVVGRLALPNVASGVAAAVVVFEFAALLGAAKLVPDCSLAAAAAPAQTHWPALRCAVLAPSPSLTACPPACLALVCAARWSAASCAAAAMCVCCLMHWQRQQHRQQQRQRHSSSNSLRATAARGAAAAVALCWQAFRRALLSSSSSSSPAVLSLAPDESASRAGQCQQTSAAPHTQRPAHKLSGQHIQTHAHPTRISSSSAAAPPPPALTLQQQQQRQRLTSSYVPTTTTNRRLPNLRQTSKRNSFSSFNIPLDDD